MARSRRKENEPMASAPVPASPEQLLAQIEAECKRLDSLGWKLVIELPIRPVLCLASTLALSMRAPEQAASPCGKVDQDVLNFIIQNLSPHSPYLRDVVHQRAYAPKPPLGGNRVPN
jgi:hypothetical protein